VKRVLLLVPLMATLPACSSGEDIVLVEGRSTCHIEPGEDVCARFSHLDSAHQANVVTYIQTAAMVAKDGSENLERVRLACAGIARDLGVPISTGEDPRFSVQETCNSVVDGLEALRDTQPEASWMEPVCEPAKLPTCMSDRSWYRFASCDALPITTVKKAAGLRAALITAALERHLPQLVIVARKAWLEATLDDPDARNDPSAGPCIRAAGDLASQGSLDRQFALRSANRILDLFKAKSEIHVNGVDVDP
jgi:hypothetical protein